VGRLATILLAALVLAPAGIAAQQTDAATPTWNRLSLSRPWQASSRESTQRQTALTTALFQGINAVRRERGLKPLITSTKLAVAAGQHTREMGMQGYFEHESFDATPFWKRIERWYPSRGFRAWSVGENLVYSSPTLTADEAVELWMNSPPHRANLLSRTWREIGISAIHFEAAPGEYEGQPVTIVTADFGMRR
jgi:uncharacterized protein YkwD